MSGLRSKVFKTIKDGNHIVGYEKIVKFNEIDIEKYKEKFYELKKSKVIIYGEFDDDKWIFLGRERTANFYFENELMYELNLAIKMYLLLKIYDERIDPRTMLIHFSSIKFILDKTKLLSLDDIDNIRDELNSLPDNSMRNYIIMYSYNFFSFYDSVKYKKIIQLLSEYKKKREIHRPRKLPDFRSIIFFDYILSDFNSSCSRYEKEKYYPIMLWWNITKSIPMRPVELSELETNCIKIIDDKYILTILNCNKGNRANAIIKPKYREVQITQELYNLIEDFIGINDPLKEQKYLFNYDIYQYYYENFDFSSNKVLYEYRDNMGGTERFYSLLNKFYWIYVNILDTKS